MGKILKWNESFFWGKLCVIYSFFGEFAGGQLRPQNICFGFSVCRSEFSERSHTLVQICEFYFEDVLILCRNSNCNSQSGDKCQVNNFVAIDCGASHGTKKQTDFRANRLNHV